MTSITESDLNLLIEQIMKKLNVSDYKIAVPERAENGEGFIGEVTFVEVKATSPCRKTYSFIVKRAKPNEELRKKSPVKEAYDREAFMYNSVFPVLLELQVNKNVKAPFNALPKCYLATSDEGKEAIILENLKPLGFEMWPKQIPQNLSHCFMVFKEYAKYHALSMALKEQKPQVFMELTENMSHVMGLFVKAGNTIGQFQKEFAKIMTLLEEKNFGYLVPKFDHIKNNMENILIQSNECEPRVICHGDCWNNNYMFKYEGTDRSNPTEMRFLDFQLSYAASPVVDLSYYFYTTCDKSTLKDFDRLLQTYYSSLTSFLTDLGCEAEKIITLETLQEHWKLYGTFGLLMSTFIVKVELSSEEDAANMAASAEKGDFKDLFDIKLRDQESYDERMVDTFVHFAEHFL